MDALTHEDAARLVARLAPQAVWNDTVEPTLEAVASVVGMSADEVVQELEILRGEQRLEELERERQAEQRRLEEIKAAREAAAKAKETPEEAEAKRQAWLDRQRLFYDHANPARDLDVSPERVRKGWQAIDEADTEKPVKRKNPMMTLVVVVIVLLAFCFALQLMTAIGGAARGTPTGQSRSK